MSLLLVDGDCGFCMRAASWLDTHTLGLTIRPLQHVDVWALGLDADAVAARLHLVDSTGTLSGAAAVAGALRRGSVAMRCVAAILDAPGMRWIAQRGYDVIARFRHRLPGGSAACRMPS